MYSDKRVGNALFVLLVSIVLYTTWVWAGIRPSFHKYTFWLSCLTLAVLVLLPVTVARWFEKWSALKVTLSDIFHDPFFYLGFFFLVYLGMQWWNSGRELMLDSATNKWMYSPPPIKDWPSSFKKEEAWQVITWFFSAWIIGLGLRSSWIGKRSLLRLLMVIALSSGLLAVFGLVQFATRTREVYWVTPLSCDFFASFGYTNHAAAYFLLTAALSAGLLFRELFNDERSPRKWRVACFLASMVLGLVAANLSLSRAGVILAWTFVLFATLYGLACSWRSLSPANRANLAAAMVGISGVLYFMVAGFCGESIVVEFLEPLKKTTTDQSLFAKVDTIMGSRSFLDVAAYEIWRDNPWFGTGAWGFRYLLALYLPPEKWGFIDGGKANVHCDPLQFLAEFGLIGAGLMFLVVLYLGIVFLRKMTGQNHLVNMVLAGLGMVCVISLIDLPFRCPAILYTWLTVLIVVPRLVRDEKKGAVVE